MDIKVNVTNQKLEIERDLRSYISGTQEFIRFRFNMDSNWDDLKVFAQFTQNGKSYNQYLSDNKTVYLPSEIKAGVCTLVLCGTGGKTVATTNYIRLTIDKNVLVTDTQSTEITESLYQQLVNKVNECVIDVSETLVEVDTSVNTANTTKSELETVTATAETTKSNLNTAIDTAGTIKSGLETDIESANTTKSELNTVIANAETTKGNLETATSDSITKIETAGAEQIEKITEAGSSGSGSGSSSGSSGGGSVEDMLTNYFLLRRNGKVFTTKIYKYSVSTSSTGVKMNANEGMVAEPSTETISGRDDYQQYGLFQHFTCNWHVDENGFNHIDALEGQEGFTKYGKVQVGEVTCGAWFGVEDTTDAILYHYSDSQTKLTPQPMKECINPDGTISPWMVHAKYIAGDIDGKPYSSKGLTPSANMGKNQGVAYLDVVNYIHQLGTHYCGTTCWDLFYRQLMMIIKYGTINSQSIMSGCLLNNDIIDKYGYGNVLAENLVAENNVKRVIVTKSNASKFVVGSYVSIGDYDYTTDDYADEDVENIASSVKIIKIEDVDDNNAAIYVDSESTFNTTLTTNISPVEWRSGSTDDVIGSDGSPSNNTSGREPFKIQGVEIAIGWEETIANTVIDWVYDYEEEGDEWPIIYVKGNVYVCENASMLTNKIASIRENYKKASAGITGESATSYFISEEATDVELGIMIPTSTDATDTTGFADTCGIAEDGDKTVYTVGGNMRTGNAGGLWHVVSDIWNGLSAGNYFTTTISPNGTRGTWKSTT